MRRAPGALLVGLAALLWATDALFRLPVVNTLDPLFVVLFEHGIGALVLLPFILLTARRQAFSLRPFEWAIAVLLGIGPAAFATLFFTASFRYVNPSVTILLQKLQPVFVLALAYAVLGEKPGRRFLLWAGLALAAAIVVSFPDLQFDFLRAGFNPRSRGVLYALAAAGIWAAATVAGKALLRQVAPNVVTFWRYAFATVTLLVLVWAFGEPGQWAVAVRGPVFRSLLYMALVPGLLAMLAYYQGMKRTTASVTTFMELVFPVGAVALNWVFLHAPLSMVQLGAGAVLLFAVTRISLAR